MQACAWIMNVRLHVHVRMVGVLCVHVWVWPTFNPHRTSHSCGRTTASRTIRWGEEATESCLWTSPASKHLPSRRKSPLRDNQSCSLSARWWVVDQWVRVWVEFRCEAEGCSAWDEVRMHNVVLSLQAYHFPNTMATAINLFVSMSLSLYMSLNG